MNVIFAETKTAACDVFIEEAARRVQLNSVAVVTRRILSCQAMVRRAVEGEDMKQLARFRTHSISFLSGIFTLD